MGHHCSSGRSICKISWRLFATEIDGLIAGKGYVNVISMCSLQDALLIFRSDSLARSSDVTSPERLTQLHGAAGLQFCTQGQFKPNHSDCNSGRFVLKKRYDIITLFNLARWLLP